MERPLETDMHRRYLKNMRDMMILSCTNATKQGSEVPFVLNVVALYNH